MTSARILSIFSLSVPVTLLKTIFLTVAVISLNGSANAQLPNFPNPFKPRPNPSQVGRIDWPAANATGFRCQTSTFQRRPDRVWVENRVNGPPSYFQEVRRSEFEVLLYDRTRNMNVRLLEDRAEWRQAQSGDWHTWPGSNGAFIR